MSPKSPPLRVGVRHGGEQGLPPIAAEERGGRGGAGEAVSGTSWATRLALPKRGEAGGGGGGGWAEPEAGAELGDGRSEATAGSRSGRRPAAGGRRTSAGAVTGSRASRGGSSAGPGDEPERGGEGGKVISAVGEAPASGLCGERGKEAGRTTIPTLDVSLAGTA